MRRYYAIALLLFAAISALLLWPDGIEIAKQGLHKAKRRTAKFSHIDAANKETDAVKSEVPRHAGRSGEELDGEVCASVTASSLDEYKELIRLAVQSGLKFHVIPQVRSIVFRAFPDKLKTILDSDSFDAFDVEMDQVLYMLPFLDDEQKRESFATGVPFGNKAPAWMGVDTSAEERGKGVVIAVLDTAVNASADAFKNANLSVMDLFNLGKEGTEASHGTMVTALLAGETDSLKGIAPSASILSVPVLDGNGYGSSLRLAEAIVKAADAGADIISMSLGFYAKSSMLEQAIEYAKSKGVVLVASAGNEGNAGEGESTVCFPGGYEGVICASAVDATGCVAEFSSTGEAVSISAPGVGLDTIDADGNSASFYGTSAAVPCVAGAIACVAANMTDGDVQKAACILLENANDAGMPGNDCEYGAGHVNVARALNSETSGIFDPAAAGIACKDNGDGTCTFFFSAQNRGTEQISNLDAVISLQVGAGEIQYLNESYNDAIKPGGIVSWAITVDFTKGASFSAGVVVNGAMDDNSRNNVNIVSGTIKSESDLKP